MKRCTLCLLFLPATPDFFYRHVGGLTSRCKGCLSESARERLSADADHAQNMRKKFRRWHYANADERREYYRLRNVQWKRDAIAAYGGRCACCGESAIEFLVIDHVNEDGHIHRKNGIRGGHIYHHLKRDGYPQDGRFQVLCHNCNMAKSMYGGCPHNGPAPYQSLQFRARTQPQIEAPV